MSSYVVEFSDPAGHLIDVTMTIERPVASQTVSMATWIPGSYMIREFAKNVVVLSATQNAQRVQTTKIDKATWSLDCDTSMPLTIRYRVYAWDRSVRTNYFDQSRGFVNPAALLLRNDSAVDDAYFVNVIAPTFAEGQTWKCATAMNAKAIDARGFGEYVAANYDELIDHPIECAAFDEVAFVAGGVPHRFVVSGKHRGDLERLRIDTQKICETQIALFGDKDSQGNPVAPFAQYVFQLHVVDEGYGGLEHRASTALICPRHCLPIRGDATIGESYLELLRLVSHEYFHSWNVKRIKPAAFVPYDTTRENYTRLLWLFEGFTDYYDELMLVRAGLITEADYLKLVARNLTQLLRTPGRAMQSIAESSFDAWIKYYRQDENSPNAIVSYYLKGGLVALLLDLKLRSEGKGSLDDVMRHLWREYGKSGRGVPDDAFAVFEQCTGASLREFEVKYVNGTEEPDWVSAFANIGLAYEPRVSHNATDRGGPASGTPEMHVRRLGMVPSDAGDVTLRFVFSGSAAHAAGLCAGDTLVAIDGMKATRATIAKHLARFAEGDAIAIQYFRHDILCKTTLTIDAPRHDTVTLAVTKEANDRALSLRRAWLWISE
jgi:predicted metalloprotease with PDZ domain